MRCDWRASPRSRYSRVARGSFLPILASIWFGSFGAGCERCSSSPKPGKTTEKERKLAGVYPENFQCESITNLPEIRQILGATKANLLTGAMTPPKGVAAPCNFEVVMPSSMEYWTYDIDCRNDMKQRADALFAQYKRTSADLVQQYNAAADAGIKPTDAGIVIKAPTDAFEVDVGAKALDHHGQGLLFIDDDAPCYVRVIGPDAARRLELAKAVAKNLTFANAPMTPRPFP